MRLSGARHEHDALEPATGPSTTAHPFRFRGSWAITARVGAVGVQAAAEAADSSTGVAPGIEARHLDPEA